MTGSGRKREREEEHMHSARARSIIILRSTEAPLGAMRVDCRHGWPSSIFFAVVGRPSCPTYIIFNLKPLVFVFTAVLAQNSLGPVCPYYGQTAESQSSKSTSSSSASLSSYGSTGWAIVFSASSSDRRRDSNQSVFLMICQVFFLNLTKLGKTREINVHLVGP